MKTAFLPLGIFLVVMVILAIGLTLDPQVLPSPLIDKPAPDFSAPVLYQPSVQLTNKNLLGKVWLLNAWASWCIACREDHAVLLEFSKSKTLMLVGLNYKDQDKEGQKWLARFGNPYDVVLADQDGRIGIDFGIYGVPESFLIDKAGIIRYKHVGPLTPRVLHHQLLPLIHQLQR